MYAISILILKFELIHLLASMWTVATIDQKTTNNNQGKQHQKSKTSSTNFMGMTINI